MASRDEKVRNDLRGKRLRGNGLNACGVKSIAESRHDADNGGIAERRGVFMSGGILTRFVSSDDNCCHVKTLTFALCSVHAKCSMQCSCQPRFKRRAEKLALIVNVVFGTVIECRSWYEFCCSGRVFWYEFCCAGLKLKLR